MKYKTYWKNILNNNSPNIIKILTQNPDRLLTEIKIKADANNIYQVKILYLPP